MSHITSNRWPPYLFDVEGVIVTIAADHRGECDAECDPGSPRSWKCSRLAGHDGPHVACFFSDTTGEPNQLAAKWSR